MMGYAMVGQIAAGLHIRQRSRAFIIIDPSTDKRVVFISADLGMGSLAVRRATLEKLKETYGDLYNEENGGLYYVRKFSYGKMLTLPITLCSCYIWNTYTCWASRIFTICSKY